MNPFHNHSPKMCQSQKINSYSSYVYIYNAEMLMLVQWFPNFTSWCPQKNPGGVHNPLSLLSLSTALGLLTYNNYVRAKMKKKSTPTLILRHTLNAIYFKTNNFTDAASVM